MPPVVVHVSVDAFAVGCAACGWSVEVRPSEIRLLSGLLEGAHTGPLVSAAHLSIEGGPAEWTGNADLVAQREAAGLAVA